MRSRRLCTAAACCAALLSVLCATLSHCPAPARASSLSVVEFESNLNCEARGEGSPMAPSAVGNIVPMTCDPNFNHYTRAVMRAEIDSDTNAAPLSVEHEFFVASSSSAAGGRRIEFANGCPDRTPGEARAPECTKLELPLRTKNGSYSLVSNRDLAEFLNLTSWDVDNVIQGLKVKLTFGHSRWAYDLEPTVDSIFPFAYEYLINETAAAHAQALEAADLAPGLVSKLAPCVPNTKLTSGRLGGALNACFRAPCNCTDYPDKPADVPDLFTYEVHWAAPTCHARRVSQGEPRLTVDATLSMSAVVKVNGTTVLDSPLFSRTFADITAAFTSSAGRGRLGSSGVQALAQRVFGGNGPFGLQVGSSPDGELTVDAVRAGGAGTTTIIKLKAELVDSYVSTGGDGAARVYLGSTQNKTASTAFFNLAGGYVIDCLSDNETALSPYRNSASNPYSTLGLPGAGEAPPPDRWFYMSDYVSRLGSLFSPHLRASCGMLGHSSAAIGLAGEYINSSICCDGTLVRGGCLPGSADANAFSSPQDVVTNGSLWKSSFSPPGFNQYNYYLLGRNKLYAQPPVEEVSGLTPALYGAPTGVFDIVLEFSDLLARVKTGGSSTRANVPPLRLEVPDEPVFQFYSSREPVVCVYNTDGSGRGAVIVQRLCNAGSGSAKANVSVSFESCTGLQYVDGAGQQLDARSPIQANLPPLPAGTCYDAFSLPIYVAQAAGVSQQAGANISPPPQCRSLFVSATRGSTRDAKYDNMICSPLYRTWNEPPTAVGYTVTVNQLDPDCERCAFDDLYCMSQCTGGAAYKSFMGVFFFWLPALFLPLALVVYVVVSQVAWAAYGKDEMSLTAYRLMEIGRT